MVSSRLGAREGDSVFGKFGNPDLACFGKGIADVDLERDQGRNGRRFFFEDHKDRLAGIQGDRKFGDSILLRV
ncbi:MAG: hypothetical protein ACK559_08280, partial [bacterium]